MENGGHFLVSMCKLNVNYVETVFCYGIFFNDFQLPYKFNDKNTTKYQWLNMKICVTIFLFIGFKLGMNLLTELPFSFHLDVPVLFTRSRQSVSVGVAPTTVCVCYVVAIWEITASSSQLIECRMRSLSKSSVILFCCFIFFLCRESTRNLGSYYNCCRFINKCYIVCL